MPPFFIPIPQRLERFNLPTNCVMSRKWYICRVIQCIKSIIYTPFMRSALCCETLGGLFYSNSFQFLRICKELAKNIIFALRTLIKFEGPGKPGCGRNQVFGRFFCIFFKKAIKNILHI